MSYSPEHRVETKRRILESAARLFRRRGYAEAGIEEIMHGAGLTRGGFYLHFKSKQQLFAEFVSQDLELGRQVRSAAEREPDAPLRGAADAIDYYLAPENRSRIARGCTIVSNAADLARGSAKARVAFSGVFADLCEEFAALVEAPEDEAEQRALAAVATCVGGVVLARALADGDQIGRLLEACRDSVKKTLDGGSPAGA